CFHSILPKPNKHQQHIMEKIIAKSCAVIAMSSTGRKLLMDVYGCDAQKTVVVHHGVPDFTFNDQSVAKKKLQVYSRYMMLVSGLLGPGKGFEYAILALPHILQAGIDVRLYIVGQTHPTILQREDEHYRRYLQKLVQEQQVEKAVVWVDRFLHLDELMEYYRAADIYITPHLDPQQPTSGTLAKALGAGKVCISTPFVYAAEMLKNDHGILVPFRDAEAIARAVIMVLKDMTLYETYRKNAYILGKTMQWPRVAKRYLDLFRIIIHNNQK
ncbi:MAG TPA: glycosyltransferase, partial [Patescibacteria group bacterium]|nr:glycosyltransferase [Patescibacteria group bacterium]